MAFQVPAFKILYGQPIDNVSLMVSIIDTNPDQFVYMQLFQDGAYAEIDLVLKNGTEIRLAPSVLPSNLTLMGCKSDDSKAYIALSVDLNNDVSLKVFGVDESGSSGGGEEGVYRVAGTVQINGVAAQRDLVIISDDPSGREIVGEGESAGDGTFDVTYTNWDGVVIVVALDKYGVAFTAEEPINAGTVVHPTTPNGYVYVVTEAGTTGTTEPPWSTSGSVVSGSATFAPRAYYRPVASGPLQGELVE